MLDRDQNSLMEEFCFSESDQEKVLCRIWNLLKKQADKYNGCDSTSMTVEKAQDLLESLLYTIGIMIHEGISPKEILDGNLQFLLIRGQEILKKKQIAVKIEWELMCQDMPKIQNVYFADTIKNLGLFFKKYDIYYGAHHIPCSIDYWLLCPVSERIKGIRYIEEYVSRLQIENDFLNCFDRERVIQLYHSCIPDYSEILFNLCDPVMTNAIGLGLIGQDVHELNVSDGQRKTIVNLMLHKTADEIRTMVEQSVVYMCKCIGMTEIHETDYFIQAAAGLSARLFEAIKHKDLSNVFISFSPEVIDEL